MAQEQKNIHIQLNELKELNVTLEKIIGQLSEMLSPVLPNESNLQGTLSVSDSGNFYIDSGSINAGSSEPYISTEFEEALEHYRNLIFELKELSEEKLFYLELVKEEE